MASSLTSPTYLSNTPEGPGLWQIEIRGNGVLDFGSLVGDHTLDLRQVSLVHHRAHIHLALSLRVL